MSEPLLWLSLGALAVQAALFLSKDLQPIQFWVLTVPPAWPLKLGWRFNVGIR